MTAIEEMAGMDVLCSDKTGTLTLNKLTVDKNLIEVSEGMPLMIIASLFDWLWSLVANGLHDFFFPQVFAKGVDPDSVVLMAARASRTENQDAIDAAIVGMLADPKEVIFCLSELSLTYLSDTDLSVKSSYTKSICKSRGHLGLYTTFGGIPFVPCC